jgi:hypothetical protein
LARRVVLGDGATAVNFTFKGVTLANIRWACVQSMISAADILMLYYFWQCLQHLASKPACSKHSSAAQKLQSPSTRLLCAQHASPYRACCAGLICYVLAAAVVSPVSSPATISCKCLLRVIVCRCFLQPVVLAACRKANNFGIDFFTNSQGSTVMFDNVVVLETACSAAPADALASAVSQPALAGHPRNSAKLLPNTCIQLPDGRRCFENSLHFNSHAQQASAQEGGYTFVQRNTTRVCLSYVDPECLRANNDDFESCWQQQALRIQPWLQPASQQAQQLSPGAIAGIAVAAGACVAWLG